MNTESLNELWNSSANRPEAEAGQHLSLHFASRLRRRRRFQAWWLAWTFSLMMGASIVGVNHLVRHGLEGVRGQWALPLLMLPPWLALAYFLRAFFRQGTVARGSALPLRAALVAAKASNAAECRHLSIVGWLFTATAPVSALAIWQLHAAGKTPGNQVWSMALAFGVIFMLGAIGLAMRFRRQLVPERLAIEARLRELDAPVAG